MRKNSFEREDVGDWREDGGVGGSEERVMLVGEGGVAGLTFVTW